MADRTLCDRCRRPPVVCFCSCAHPLATRTRVVLLQHPKERKVGVGTARMAHLGLTNSILRVGVDFSADPEVRAALATPDPICVLFPKSGAMDVAALPRDRPVTLVVLDGTWSLARKLLRLNPALAALPHVAFAPQRPSQYRIRRQPSDMCLSTIEALAEVLSLLEPEAGPFGRLLDPFRAMVERQERFVVEVGARRHRRPVRPGRQSLRARLGDRLSRDWERLVCVQGDANAWPRRDPARRDPEIVHWVAHRPATGETFDVVVAPRRPLAPHTPAQVELSPETIRAGGGVSDWLRAWRDFARPDDIVVSWGSFFCQVAAEDRLPLAADMLDLRREALGLLRQEALAVSRPPERSWSRPGDLRNPRTGRLRTVDECADAMGVAVAPLGMRGRAGRRLAALAGVLASLAKRQPSASSSAHRA